MVLYRLLARHECMGHTKVSTGFRLYQAIDNLVHTSGHRHLLGTPVIRLLAGGVVIHNSSFIPGRQQSFVYTRSSAIPRPYQGEAIHTSGHGVGSASSAGKLQRSDSWAVCVSGAWASAIHAEGTVLDSVFPPFDSSQVCPAQWEAVPNGSGQQLQVGQRLYSAACQDERHGAAEISNLAWSLQQPSLLV